MDPDRPAYSIVEGILRPILTAVYRVEITGRDHIPDERAVHPRG